MNFKEILERYQAGTATVEEQKFVAAELEKYESIEEYYADNISDQLFTTDFEDTTEAQAEDTDGIKKVVNKRLRNMVLTSVLAVVVLYIAIFYGASNIIDTFYYDPTEVSFQGEEDELSRPDFHYDLRAYISLNMPGYALSGMAHGQSEGFGNYEMNYSMRDLFSTDNEIHFMNISRNNLTFGINGIFDHRSGFNSLEGFEKIHSPFPEEASDLALELRDGRIAAQNETTLEYLEGLNDLSYVAMNLTFKDDITMTELHTLQNDHHNIEFKWVGVRTTEAGARWSEDNMMHLIGFNPIFNDEPATNHRLDPEEYPLFDILDVMEIQGAMPIDKYLQVYGTHFTSRLKYLSEQEEFIEIFDSNPEKVDFYKDALAYVEENGVESYGLLVYGTPEDLLELLDDVSYDTLFLKDVLPTKPYIY